MGKAYSSDLRSRFVSLLERGLSASGVGRRLLVPRSTATRWAKIWRDEGRAEALAMGGDRRSAALEAHASTIRDLVEQRPDIFLHEIVADLASKGVSTSEDAVSALLTRHGITQKKRRCGRVNATARTSPRIVPHGRR